MREFGAIYGTCYQAQWIRIPSTFGWYMAGPGRIGQDR